MISSFGMVLAWPRYLVLFGFVTVCFAYFFLARMEERECERTFTDYDEYRSNTGMFLPPGIENIFNRFTWPEKKTSKVVSVLGLYIIIMLMGFTVARGIHSYSINNLYTYTTQQEVYLSLGQITQDEIAEMVTTVKSDSVVEASLNKYQDTDDRFINYVMPASLFVSEVPMYLPEGKVPTHEWPGDKDQSHFKVIFSLAQFGPDGPFEGLNILDRAVNKTPVLEVWINRNSQSVEKIFHPPTDKYYEGMPVPVF